MTSHFSQIEVRGEEGNIRGSTSDLQGKMTSEIMVQIVPLLRTKRGKEHQWFCHGSHVFGLWDISLKKSGYYKFFWGPDLISDECHLLVIFTAFSMKDFLLIFGQDKLDDICQLCYFYYQKIIYIWIRHMAIFSRDAVESKHPLFSLLWAHLGYAFWRVGEHVHKVMIPYM